MNAKTLQALKASIAKWERNARVRKPENFKTASTDCPLCALFLPPLIWGNACLGCPVFKASGQIHCAGTPYMEALRCRLGWDAGKITAKEAHAAARAEVAFLKSLLPEGET